MSKMSSPKCFVLFIALLLALTSRSNCHQSLNLHGVYIEWENLGSHTEFHATSKLSELNDPSDSWLAIGLNTQPKMTNANAIICLNSASKSSVNHYVNSGMYTKPVLLDSENPSLGLSSSNVTTIEHQSGIRPNVSCSFRRDNTNSATGYISIDSKTKLYLLVAYGAGDLDYHGPNKQASDSPITFPVAKTDRIEEESIGSEVSVELELTAIESPMPSAKADSPTTAVAAAVEAATSSIGSTTQSINLNDVPSLDPPQAPIFQFFIDVFNWIVSLIFKAG